MGWMEFIVMIGITSKKKLITLKAGQRPKAPLVGVLITNPEYLPEHLLNLKLRFHGPDYQLNQYHCLNALHIDQDQIDQMDDESPSQLQKFDLLNLSIHRSEVGIQIHVSTEPLGRLLQYLSKKLQS